MHPEAERLAQALIRDFWAADHSIKWLGIEEEMLQWLSSNTVLVGKRDARGQSEAGMKFFADWKSASKYKAGSGKYAKDKRLILKAQWKMNPQALTYGVLGGSEIRDFLVRWAFKTDPVVTDFEWYTYSQAELDWWKGELLIHADRIRTLRRLNLTNWPTDLTHCTRYGEDYKCPFRDEGCHKLNFTFVPSNHSPKTESHLQIENTLKTQEHGLPMDGELVILDASRMDDWLGCNELYRRKWEPYVDKQSGKCYDGLREANEALDIGHDFHELYATYLKTIQSEQKK